MAHRVQFYNIEQITESFSRYRGDHIFDKKSFKNEFIKHFNPKLWSALGNEVFQAPEIEDMIKANRSSLEKRGKLPKWDFTNKELKQTKEVHKWAMTEIKGRKVRAKEVKIKIKGKTLTRYRDSFGRFTSNPS